MSVSIIIPSYNSAGYVAATIRSVLAQTQPVREIIVVDDGSTDETEAVCREFSGQISYHRRANQGVSAARNFGAEQAGGEWLLFLDSDDRLLPHAIAALRTAVRESACRLAYGYVLLRGKEPVEGRLHGYPFAVGAAPLPAAKNFWRSVISTPGAALVHGSLHAEVGGFVSGYEPMEDRDYWVKCGTLADFGFCDTCVLDKTWREGSAVSQAAKRIVRGMRAQIDYLAWCRARGIDLGFLAVDEKKIVERALKSALWEKRREVLPELLAEARARHATGFWYYRARAELALRGVA